MWDRRGNKDYHSHSKTGTTTMQNGNKQNVCTILKLVGLTTCGTSAAVAIINQTTPSTRQTQWVKKYHSQQDQCPTCFQRTNARSRKALSRWWRRNKPASMMSSRVTSVASVLRERSLTTLICVFAHALAAGTHTAPIWWWIRQEGQGLKTVVYFKDTWCQITFVEIHRG